MNNILVVNVNWLGDVVFSTPVFKALKEKYPQARVNCLCVKRVKDVLDHCPFIDETIVLPDEKNIGSLFQKLRLIFLLRKRKFDAVFLLHRSMTRALIVYLAGIPIRVGYATPRRSWLLTHRIQTPTVSVHRSDEYLNVIEGFGVDVHDRRCYLKPQERLIQEIDKKLLAFGINDKRPLVVINPGGNWDLKRWPAAHFSLLIKQLSQTNQAEILISGSENDLTLARRIARDAGVNPLVWAGKSDIKELLALFKRADVVISNDTGPAHLAAAVGTNVIAIFGPTRPEITLPRGTGQVDVIFKEIGCNKAPCYHLACDNNLCMQSVTVEDVYNAYQKITHS